jgi:hypothetical protein
MEMKSFCSSIRNEMTAWKAKTYDLIRKTEEMSPSPDQKVKASIDDMKSMIDRIGTNGHEHGAAAFAKRP